MRDTKRYAFDDRCAELASYFLRADGSHTPERVAELAQEIQNAVEGYLE
jgi:hypothetical protein